MAAFRLGGKGQRRDNNDDFMLLTIEKLVYGGDGLAHTPADANGRRQAVFVPFVLAGEQIEADETGHGRGFLRARLERVVEPATGRVPPACPYFAACGGCHYQHAAYEHQLEIKSAILRENLRRIGGIDWPGEISIHPSPPWNYRNRTRMQMLHDSALAYFRFGSRVPLPIEQCPISSQLINRAIAAIAAFGREHQFPAGIREIEFFADDADSRLMLELYLQPGARLSRQQLRQLLERLRGNLPELATLAVFPPADPHGGDSQRSSAAIAGEPHFIYRAAGFDYRVSPGAFFQTNRFLTDKLIEVAVAGCTGRHALDLYAGVGLFSLPLARNFAQVTAVEASPASAADLQHNAPANVQVAGSTTEEFLNHASGVAPDFVVVDPPRAGLSERVGHALVRLAPHQLTYVACDPATLARDLKTLVAGGYGIKALHLLDLFPQTFHVESVVHLVRE